MRNKLTSLSISAVALAFVLSSGAAYARNILPDALNNPNWPNSRSYPAAGSERLSPIDDKSNGPGSRAPDYERATRIMDRAIKEKNKGNFAKSCKLANQATDIVSRSRSLVGTSMESDYAAFAAEVCDAAVKA